MDSTRKERVNRLIANQSGDNGNGHSDNLHMIRNMEMIANLMLTTRSEMLNKLFDPRRDIDEECGYPKEISSEQHRRMYDRDIGRRVVDVYPSETWKEFPLIYEEPDPQVDTPFEVELEKLNKHHHLLCYLQRVDELSGIGHYGIILWGIDDGKVLSEPVDGFERWAESTGDPDSVSSPPQRKLLFIRTLDESLVNIAEYERDVTNPRYGLPTYYNITLSDPRVVDSGSSTSPPDLTQQRVHWTRVTHVADNRKTSEVLGTPRQEPVWNRIYDLRKILSGSGEMYWKGGFPGLGLTTQPNADGTSPEDLDQESIRDAMFKYMNGLQRYISLANMSITSLSPQISDPSSTFEVQIKAICVIIGVPYRVFMGIEEGVVSGDQATRAWEGRLANRQSRYVTPLIINPVIQRLIDYGILPNTKEPMGWTVEWPDKMAPTREEEADFATKLTEAMSKYVGGGVDTLIAPMEFLTLICGLEDDVAQSVLDGAVKHIGSMDGNAPVPAREPTPPEPPTPPGQPPVGQSKQPKAAYNMAVGQPRDKQGRWTDAGGGAAGLSGTIDTGGIGGALGSEGGSLSVESLLTIDSGVDMEGNRDVFLEKMASMNGFDAKPQVVSSAEFDSMAAKNDLVVMHRGTDKEQASDQFKNGAYYGGWGGGGSGMYFAADNSNHKGEDIAKTYGQHVMKAGLKKDAKVVDINTMNEEAAKFSEALMQEGFDTMDRAKVKLAQKLTNPGRYAMFKGYDAMSNDLAGFTQYVVLNRGAMVVPG